MKHFSSILSALACSLLLLTASCNEPTILGSDLVAEDSADIHATDTFGIVATTFFKDPPLTYIPGTTPYFTSHICGHLESNVFGSEDASIYQQYVSYYTSSSSTFGFDDLQTVDSVLLTIYLDSLAVYGDTLAPFALDVYRVTEDMPYATKQYATQDYATDLTPLGSLAGFLPRPRTVYKAQASSTDTTKVSKRYPMVIRLDKALGYELLGYDSLAYSSGTKFIEKFKGIHIAPRNSNKAILGLQTASSNLSIYYTAAPDSNKVWSLIPFSSGVSLGHYEHDYTNAVVDDFVGDASKGDSLLFLQAMQGTQVLLNFPSLRSLGDVAINRAEVDVTVAIPLSDTTFLPKQLVCGYYDDEGVFVRLAESQYAFPVGNSTYGPYVFGGVPEDKTEDGMKLKTYRLNIASHMQNLLEDTAAKPIYIQIVSPRTNTAFDYTTQNCASKVVFYGPKHSKYPMKLHLAYTRIHR
jgi:hypothetical protein